MLAIKFVEIAVVGRVMLGTIPPVPVAAFGDQNFVEGQFALSLGGAGSILRVELAGLVQVVPGTIIFGCADPDVEVRIDP